MSGPKSDNSNNGSGESRQYAARQNTGAGYTNTLMNKDLTQKQSQEDIAVIRYAQEQEAASQANATDSTVQAKTNPPTGERPAEERATEENTAEVRTSGNVQVPQAPRQTPQIPDQNTTNKAEVRIPEAQPAEVRTQGEIQEPQTPTQTPQEPVVVPPSDVPLASENSEEDIVTEAVEGAKEAAEKAPEVAEKENKPTSPITSYVGDHKPEKGIVVNLGKDVAFVQKRLMELGILSSFSYKAEMISGEGNVSADSIPLTIAAIDHLQKNILDYSTRYGYIKPGKHTISELVSLTLEKVKAKEAALRKKEADAKAKKEKAIAYAKKKAHIEAIMNEPATEESAEKIVKQYYTEGSAEILGKHLKDYALHNPKLTLLIYDEIGYSKTDDVTRALMGQLTDTEIVSLNTELDSRLYETLDEAWTVEEEYKLMAKLKAGKTKEPAKASKEPSKNKVKEADKDFNTIRKALNYNLSGSVGKGKANYPSDVKMVAIKLKEKYEVSQECIDSGKYDATLEKAIGDFQISIGSVNEKGEPDYAIDPNYNTHKKLFGFDTKFKSGLKDIHAGTSSINAVLGQQTITGGVGDENTTLKTKPDNKPENVKIIAALLKEVGKQSPDSGIKVPVISITEGKCNNELIEAIKKFEKFINRSKQHGVVLTTGKNFTELQKYSTTTMGQIKYDYTKGTHTKGVDKEAYYEKLEVLDEKLGIKEDSNIDKILTIARKAATDEEYFNAFTKNESAVLELKSEDVKQGEFTLSPVLAERMRRFHKFLVAAGMYSGNMGVGTGVRGKEKAHNFCAQWIIGSNAKGGRSATAYVKATKENLIKMYNNSNYRNGDEIIDSKGQAWAKKEHFEENKEGEVTLKWDKVQKYVKTFNFGRSDIDAPANSGCDTDSDRMPVPSKSIGPSITNHRGGNAMDINSRAFTYREDTITDLVAHAFGLVRAGGAPEYWHFELTDLALSTTEKKIEKNKTYPELKK